MFIYCLTKNIFFDLMSDIYIICFHCAKLFHLCLQKNRIVGINILNNYIFLKSIFPRYTITTKILTTTKYIHSKGFNDIRKKQSIK